MANKNIGRHGHDDITECAVFRWHLNFGLQSKCEAIQQWHFHAPLFNTCWILPFPVLIIVAVKQTTTSARSLDVARFNATAQLRLCHVVLSLTHCAMPSTNQSRDWLSICGVVRSRLIFHFNHIREMDPCWWVIIRPNHSQCSSLSQFIHRANMNRIVLQGISSKVHGEA